MIISLGNEDESDHFQSQSELQKRTHPHSSEKEKKKEEEVVEIHPKKDGKFLSPHEEPYFIGSPSPVKAAYTDKGKRVESAARLILRVIEEPP